MIADRFKSFPVEAITATFAAFNVATSAAVPLGTLKPNSRRLPVAFGAHLYPLEILFFTSDIRHC